MPFFPQRLRSCCGLLLVFAFLLAPVLATVDEKRRFRDEWAIMLGADTTAEEFAARHDLDHVGSIEAIGVDLFRLKTDHYSKGPWKTQRQAAFETLLESCKHKCTDSVPHPSHRTQKRHTESDDEASIVWYQRQELHRRDKRSVGAEAALTLPTDPLFAQQWHLQPPTSEHVSIDVFGAWEMGFHGEGVTIAICDDGFDLNHPDIKANYNPEASYNFNKNTNDTGPNSLTVDWHGTSSGGMAAARDDGSACGVGAAYRAQLSAVVILQFAEIADADEARALSFRTDLNHIYSNSWGPTDDSNRKEGPKPLTAAAMENSIRTGRQGLGSVYVWSSGNGRRSSDNCNYDGYANWRYTITVGAVDYQGNQAWYSESCSAIHFVAPSSGSSGVPRNFQFVITSDLLGSRGLEQGDCNTRFSGTSAACPLAAGVVALVLQARPDVNWIELQQILIDSTIKNNPTDPDWVQNSAGRWYNHKYGFGLINATQAVLVAQDFHTRINLTESTTEGKNPSVANFATSPDGWGASTSINIAETITIRHVEVYLTASTLGTIGSLKIVLKAPTGTVAVLADRHGDQHKQYSNWRFTSLKSWGEKSAGTWTLSVTDVSGSQTAGELTQWSIKIYGGDGIPDPPYVPRLRTPSTIPKAPGQGDISSGVARAVPTGRWLILIASAVPLVFLGVLAGYARLSGKYSSALGLSMALIVVFVIVASQVNAATTWE